MINLAKVNSGVPIIALTGSGGRLGGYLIESFAKIGIKAVSVPREALSTDSTIKEYLKKTNPLVLVNSAAVSQGSFAAMRKINVEMAVNLGKAASDLDIPFIQMSTNAAGIPGINQEQTPYAFSKKLAKDQLSQNKGRQTIVALDALIGSSENNQIDISTLAFGGAPMTVQILGERQIIQPTSYLAASKTIANIADEYIKGHHLPSQITIAGEPIALGDFIHLTKSDEFLFEKLGLELQVKPEDLFKFAELIQNGSLSPEFLNLGKMVSANPVVHDIENFEHYHGDPIPTHKELADLVKKTTTLSIAQTFWNIFKTNPKKLEFSTEAINVFRKCNIRPAKKNNPTTL